MLLIDGHAEYRTRKILGDLQDLTEYVRLRKKECLEGSDVDEWEQYDALWGLLKECEDTLGWGLYHLDD